VQQGASNRTSGQESRGDATRLNPAEISTRVISFGGSSLPQGEGGGTGEGQSEQETHGILVGQVQCFLLSKLERRGTGGTQRSQKKGRGDRGRRSQNASIASSCSESRTRREAGRMEATEGRERGKGKKKKSR